MGGHFPAKGILKCSSLDPGPWQGLAEVGFKSDADLFSSLKKGGGAASHVFREQAGIGLDQNIQSSERTGPLIKGFVRL